MLVTLILFLLLVCFYFYLFIASQKKYSVEYGISFNRQHAEYLGLDWRQVYLGMLDELKPKYLRIAAPWSEVEAEAGQMNGWEIDWQMSEAEKRGVKVILVVGQKAPRWPECHVPEWAGKLSGDKYEQALFKYISYIVERYKNNHALELWQVENEPFISFKFGECASFRKDLVKKEIALARELDPIHKIIITDSGELSTWREAIKAGDLFGTTLYRIVRKPSGRIWTYDWLPASFYNFKARFWGKDLHQVFIAELQAEPWFDIGGVDGTSLEKQRETMNLDRLQEHFSYAESTGFSRAYLWGVEWWYWMKDKQGDESYWEMVKAKIK